MRFLLHPQYFCCCKKGLLFSSSPSYFFTSRSDNILWVITPLFRRDWGRKKEKVTFRTIFYLERGMNSSSVFMIKISMFFFHIKWMEQQTWKIYWEWDHQTPNSEDKDHERISLLQYSFLDCFWNQINQYEKSIFLLKTKEVISKLDLTSI